MLEIVKTVELQEGGEAQDQRQCRGRPQKRQSVNASRRGCNDGPSVSVVFAHRLQRIVHP